MTTAYLKNTEIESLEKLYTFLEQTEVIQFLNKYPFLVPMLLQAPDQIYRYFPDTQLFLEYLPDPEIDNHLLAVHISTNLDSEQAMDTLDQLYDDWWINVSLQSQGKLCIDIE